MMSAPCSTVMQPRYPNRNPVCLVIQVGRIKPGGSLSGSRLEFALTQKLLYRRIGLRRFADPQWCIGAQ